MSNTFELSSPTVEIAGRTERYPVRRIYCVGRNYAAHAHEMGLDADRNPPTGTPAGVGPVVVGDRVAGGVDGVDTLTIDVV